MTNELKLIMALCDALGFEVSESLVFDEAAYLAAQELHKKGASALMPPKGHFKHFDYKLTKKEVDPLFERIPPKEWHPADILAYKNSWLSPAQLFMFQSGYDQYKMNYHNRAGNEQK